MIYMHVTLDPNLKGWNADRSLFPKKSKRGQKTFRLIQTVAPNVAPPDKEQLHLKKNFFPPCDIICDLRKQIIYLVMIMMQRMIITGW